MRLLNSDALRIAATVVLGLAVYLLLTYALDGEITPWRVATGLLVMGGVVWASHRQSRGADTKRAGLALLVAGVALIAVVVIVVSTR